MQRYRRHHIELACRVACEAIGITYCPGPDGWDKALVDLAEQCLFDHDDIVQRPSRVARAITEYLDDIAANP